VQETEKWLEKKMIEEREQQSICQGITTYLPLQDSSEVGETLQDSSKAGETQPSHPDRFMKISSITYLCNC
jgi:hypothetical protein